MVAGLDGSRERLLSLSTVSCDQLSGEKIRVASIASGVCLINLSQQQAADETLWYRCLDKQRQGSLKGGDPAAGSPTATLLRLSPNHGVHLRRLPPEG